MRNVRHLPFFALFSIDQTSLLCHFIEFMYVLWCICYSIWLDVKWKDSICLQSISQSFIWKQNKFIKSVMINIWYQYVLITYENICTKTSGQDFENLENQGDNYIFHILSPKVPCIILVYSLVPLSCTTIWNLRIERVNSAFFPQIGSYVPQWFHIKEYYTELHHLVMINIS